MKKYQLMYSPLSKRVYIVIGKDKIDVTESFEEIQRKKTDDCDHEYGVDDVCKKCNDRMKIYLY